MKILFLGDTFYDHPYIAEDIRDIIEYIQKNDLRVILNLETSIGDLGKPIKKRGPNLRSDDVVLDILKQMNCLAVCLANNHAMDYGDEALRDAIVRLHEAGIATVGAGENFEEAIKPFEFSDGNESFALFNFGWDVEETVYATKKSAGCAPLDRAAILQLLAGYKAVNPDRKLISVFHWGFEFNTLPMPIDIDLAHKAIDVGCELIVGHHPHVTQPIEEYRGKKIFYSLGNFYFSSMRNSYKTNYINEFKDNFGDYGLGIVYDTSTGVQHEIIIYYDREDGKSKILEDIDKNVVRELPKTDWTSEEYVFLAKNHAYKPNPILTLDENKNQKELSALMRKYWIADKVAFLKKSKLGLKLYEFLKSKS